MSYLSATATGAAAQIESRDCLILPGHTIDVGSIIPGQIAEVMVDIGDEVVQGQIIASLNTAVQAAVLEVAKQRAADRSQIAVAQARLDYETKELARTQELRERGVIATSNEDERLTAFDIRKSEMQAALADFQLAQLDVLRAETELEIRRIRAPIDGVVAERHLDPSEYLRDDGKVVTLVSLDPLRVDVFLPQDRYREIGSGQTVAIESDLLPGETFVATVDAIDRVIDAASATFRVRLTLPNDAGRVVPGTRCVAVFN